MRRPLHSRSTPQGEHRAVLLDDVLRILDPQPGMTVVDCTVGWAGHSAELLQRIGPSGMLIGFDMDSENLPKARQRLDGIVQAFPPPPEASSEPRGFHLHHGNFAGLLQVLAMHGISQVDALLADLGMSSMQVDDPARGFSYARDGALDMRMDQSRGRTASQLLAAISVQELATALAELADEPQAETIAQAIVAARDAGPIATTRDLSQIIQQATKQEKWQLHPTQGKWNLHPAARTFQALRILVNRELGNLDNLLRVLPGCLRPGGKAAIISFHSGEDRLVKAAFRNGLNSGTYSDVADDPVRASFRERTENPRSRSAKLRWCKRV